MKKHGTGTLIHGGKPAGGTTECGQRDFPAAQLQLVVLTPSPTRLVRGLLHASRIDRLNRRYESFQDHLLVIPSSTCYKGSTAGDVIVAEPPHHPVRQTIPSHRRIARMLTLQKMEPESLENLLSGFDEFLQRFEDRQHNPLASPANVSWASLGNTKQMP